MLTLICALDRQRAIGFEGRMLFRLRADLQRFKALTSGHTVIMGRKTFDSLPKGALPNRRNFVISRSLTEAPTGTFLFHSLEDALQAAGDAEEIFIIGGSSVYEATLPMADRLCLTHIHATAPQADVFFPEIDETQWSCTFREDYPADAQNEQPFTFADYIRL